MMRRTNHDTDTERPPDPPAKDRDDDVPEPDELPLPGSLQDEDPELLWDEDEGLERRRDPLRKP